MPLILSGNVASATADAGYTVDNSVRLNDGDSAYMHKTLGAGNRKTWTYSVWIKRCTLGTNQTWTPVQADSANNNAMAGYFDTSDRLNLYDYNAPSVSAQIITNRKFRDTSAWYHFVIAVDTEQGTANNRLRFYVNGVEERGVGGYGTDTMPAEDYEFNLNQDTEELYIGANYTSSVSTPSDMYMAEACFIDGTQYAASDFGEFDEDSPTIWKPKDVSGLTFGTNGFYLDFEDSANLGNDANGGTDLTEVNLAAADQATDTPTNNFCTMNPLENWAADNTFSEGNCVISGTTGAWQCSSGTMGFSKGKWYWELRYEGGTESYQSGVRDITANAFTTHAQNGVTIFYNARADNSEGGEMFLGSVGVNTSEDFGTMNTSSDVLGVACNFDDGQISYYVNGSIMVTNHALDSTTDNKNTLFPFTAQYTTNVTKYNFGGCSGFTISSAASDANGYGVFEHAPPSGYYALCTKNLAEYG